MEFFKRTKYLIATEEIKKLQDEISNLRQENARLTLRCNYEHLVAEIEKKDREIKYLSQANNDLNNELKKLNQRIDGERTTTSLMVRTLKDSLDLNTHLVSKINGCKSYPKTQIITAGDILDTTA